MSAFSDVERGISRKATRISGSRGALAVGAAVLLAGLSSPRSFGDEPGDREKPRYNLSPAYARGATFRVEMRFQQTTVTQIPQGLVPQPPVDWSAYDAMLDLDVVVTIDAVDARGGAQAYSARLTRFRVDVPDPLQTQEYRLRVRERKRLHLPANAHPLEGETVRYDATSKGGKPRIFRVLRDGEDAAITQRYPEVVPLMQELIEPNWTPADTQVLGGVWEMNADHLFRLTRVIARAPIKGVIQARLANVADGMAYVDVASRLTESFAKVDMTIQARGRIEFDLARRRSVRSSVKGEVQISSPTSSLTGRGTLVGFVEVSDAPPSELPVTGIPTAPAGGP